MTIQEARKFYLKYRMWPGFHIARDHLDNMEKMDSYKKLNISKSLEEQWYKSSNSSKEYTLNHSSWFYKD